MEALNQSVLSFAREDVARLREDLTVREALDAIRAEGVGEQIVYFYVVDEEDRLVGVLPTRRLLTSPLDQRLSDIMIRGAVTIPHTATVLDAAEMFLSHRFLALPVVDDERRVVGVVDISILSEGAVNAAERESMNQAFEYIGFRVSQVREASPIRAFRFRFPWLLATIGSGTICAMLASAYETTLAQSIILAFFLTLVLGLGESVSMQSMTVAIQVLRGARPTWAWYLRSLRREAGTAMLLGGACGTAVGLIVWLWKGAWIEGVTIGAGILCALSASALIGLSVPSLFHALRFDPRVAAGPVTLALADICTLLFYFSLAAWLL